MTDSSDTENIESCCNDMSMPEYYKKVYFRVINNTNIFLITFQLILEHSSRSKLNIFLLDMSGSSRQI